MNLWLRQSRWVSRRVRLTVNCRTHLMENVQWVSTWVYVGNVCRFHRHGHRSGGVSHDCNVQWSKMRGNVKPVITGQFARALAFASRQWDTAKSQYLYSRPYVQSCQKGRVLPKLAQNRFPTMFSQKRIWPSSKHHNVRLYCPFQCTIFTRMQCIDQLSECSRQNVKCPALNLMYIN